WLQRRPQDGAVLESRRSRPQQPPHHARQRDGRAHHQLRGPRLLEGPDRHLDEVIWSVPMMTSKRLWLFAAVLAAAACATRAARAEFVVVDATYTHSAQTTKDSHFRVQ